MPDVPWDEWSHPERTVPPTGTSGDSKGFEMFQQEGGRISLPDFGASVVTLDWTEKIPSSLWICVLARSRLDDLETGALVDYWVTRFFRV